MCGVGRSTYRRDDGVVRRDEDEAAGLDLVHALLREVLGRVARLQGVAQ